MLARHGQPGYQHYGSLGVYRRDERWAVELPTFERYWKPFLESGSGDANARRAALEQVAGTVSRAPPNRRTAGLRQRG